MKKKIAILLAAVMTTAMLPMNAMAASSNSINKTVTVAVDKAVKDVYLNIRPNDEVASGDTIAITIEGAEFFEEDGTTIDKDTYKFDDYKYSVKNSKNNTSYDWDAAVKAGDEQGTETFIDTLLDFTAELPYSLKRNGAKEMQVTLYEVPSGYAGKKYNETALHYHIPIAVKATSTGDIKVTVDANETSISGGGTYTIATATSSSGSTTTTVEEIKNFEDIGKIKPITIKENVVDTFDAGKTVTLRLNGGFNFKANSTITVAPGINANFKAFDVTVGKEDDEVTFEMPDVASDKASAIRLENIEVVADDEDDDWGEVKLTVSGASISKETIVIGNRADFGFALTAVEEVPTLVAGRFEFGYGSAKVYDDDCVAAQFKFEETIPNTWITERKLEFSVPEGVQIYAYEFDDAEEVSDSELEANASLTNDNTTLKIERGIDLGDDRDDCAEFKVKLYLSADADFEGDVTVSVAGGGVAEDTIEDIVIAKVIAPIAISATETKTNLGYQSVATSDITITEAQEGIFLKNGEVVVELDASFGTQEIGFADEGIDYEIDGELEIKNFDVNDGAITFKIDKESYNEPSSITFKNVKVGTTRSVPQGAFDIKVSGDAVINNYDDDGVDSTKNDGKGIFDTTSSYSFNNYLTVGTVTGTFDDTVKVTIGEKTILINDEAQDMDVAPYIQASSNSTMVPLRFVAVALGVDPASISNPDESSKVTWDANTKTVAIYYGAGINMKIVKFTAGSNEMSVNGTVLPMENGVTAEIKDGRMFVPFRALGNALGVNVTWDADTKTATYSAE